MKYKLNKQFEKLKNFVKKIDFYFSQNKNTIHKARNELKVLKYRHLTTVVKSFKTPHFLNKIIYTFFKPSKAKKSYEYALLIGDLTPTPIAYIEFFSYGLLKHSYFIAEKFDYDFTIREPLLDNSFPNKKIILQDFAKFTYSLHEKGILHQDFSPGNILIKKDNDTYIFKIVDINRMQFKQLSVKEKAKNFSKLWATDHELQIIAKQYARISGLNEKRLFQQIQFFNKKHKNLKNLKKRLKGIEVVD